ncbi:hypothetical protein GCM10023322_45050 [Rugosimonospora acidiphila]|uniref:Phosphoglycerol transferase MdoB n=1 Tax=Rugosimonospora acidiphila TaxID=556531 RepID=A0ABP9S1N0_9ACTN
MEAEGAVAAENAGAGGGVAAAGGAGRRPGWRVGLAWLLTTLAALFVFFALVGPIRLDMLTFSGLVRIPVEGLLGVLLILALPPRPRRVVAAVLGAVLGLLTILKIIDMGFYEVLDRPFDPVLDWVLIGDGANFVERAAGPAGEIGAWIAAVLLVLAVVTFMTLAVLRLSRIVVRHRRNSVRTVAVLGFAWVLCAVFGAQILPDVSVASTDAATLAYGEVAQLPADVKDQKVFRAEMAQDQFANTPGDQMLTALRGKDVLVTFVESYGVVALQDPQVDAVLDAGTKELEAAGFGARSALLTSPTFGGGSWLAQSTLMSGLWVDNQQRYNDLVAGHRLSLTTAFGRTGSRIVGVEPAVTEAWPQGAYYGFDKLYTAQNTTYQGPRFNFSSIPDQYSLADFQRSERATGHDPVMAFMALLSSHTPWAPIPHLVGWDSVGDGSIYDGMPQQTTGPVAAWRTSGGIRTAYMQSIQYTLSTLISYVKTYGDKNLVLVFLGDHQPASVVSGDHASRNVPITIVAGDPSVLDRISGWGWQDGLRPNAQAPLWRMDTFRDRFLTAFGSQPAPAPSQPH